MSQGIADKASQVLYMMFLIHLAFNNNDIYARGWNISCSSDPFHKILLLPLGQFYNHASAKGLPFL